MHHAVVQTPQTSCHEHARPGHPSLPEPAREEETTLSLPTSIMSNKRVRLPLAVGALMAVGAAFRLAVVNATFLTVGLSGGLPGDSPAAFASRHAPEAVPTVREVTPRITEQGVGLARFPVAPGDVDRPTPAMFDPLSMTLRPVRLSVPVHTPSGKVNTGSQVISTGDKRGQMTSILELSERAEKLDHAEWSGASRTGDAVEIWFERCTPNAAG